MKARKIIENTYTWNQVKKILETGRAREEFGVGGEFTVMVEGIGEVAMQILDFDRERVVPSGKNHNMTVMFRDLILEEKQFDKDGNNTWRTSSLRTELNSPMFINRFEEGFRNLIVPVLKDNTDGIDTEDTFFLVSNDELKNKKKRYAFFETEKDCVKVNKNGETDWYWTRSANRSNANYVMFVVSSGGVYSTGAWNANTYAPIVFLKALWLLHSNNCPEDIDKEPKSLAQPKQYRG